MTNFLDIYKNHEFFNVGEREETKLENLGKTIGYPIEVYKKYNGFLGIVGYKEGEVLYCSKSTNEGVYAELVKKHLSPLEEKIKKIVSQGYSMVFEILDENDVHIVYEDEGFTPILLDIIKNDIHNFEKLSYDELTRIAKEIGVECKMYYGTISNDYELQVFVDEMIDMDFEGFVFEGREGMVKLKTKHYLFWKEIRSDLHRIVSKIKKECLKNKDNIWYSNEYSNPIDFIEDLSANSKFGDINDFLNHYFLNMDLSIFQSDELKHHQVFQLFQEHQITPFGLNIPDLSKIGKKTLNKRKSIYT